MDNKTLTRNFYEALTAGRFTAIDEIVSEAFVEHEEIPTDADGREGLHEMLRVSVLLSMGCLCSLAVAQQPT